MDKVYIVFVNTYTIRDNKLYSIALWDKFYKSREYVENYINDNRDESDKLAADIGFRYEYDIKELAKSEE